MLCLEALIVTAAALALIVVLDASYAIALCLMRWAPSLALGLTLGWLFHHNGMRSLEAIALAFLTSIIAKRVLASRRGHP